MKIINYGSNFQIFEDDLKTFDTFPAGTYKVAFHPMQGFSLEKIDSFELKEEKIYGSHEEKIEKVLGSYDRFNRSLGIILSGDKGMGKSLFVQLLAQAAEKKGMPVIMVTQPYPGVADFLEKIKQECLIVFDEFEKVFSIDGDKGETQNNLLGLFDGTSQQKRLYAITVNNLHRVSEFMVSRTGRFHYHLRFDYPTPQEIEIYLTDKLESQYHNQIKHVIAFANRVKLNYDSLRAIAFEINGGHSFGAAIGDLNILTTDRQRYDVTVHFTNGKFTELKGQTLDLFSDSIQLSGYAENGDYFNANFGMTDVYVTGGNNEEMIVHGENVRSFVRDDEDENTETKVTSILIKHHKDSSVNYRMVTV